MARIVGNRRTGFCCYCKRGPLEATTSRSRLALTRDHINPKARGGGRTVPCCRQCNGLKGHLSPQEWFWFIDNHPSYWRHFRSHTEVARAVAQERIRRARAGEDPLSRDLMGTHGDSLIGGQFNG